MHRTIIVGCLLLSGCGVAAKIQARQAYQQAVSNYDACLTTNSNNPSQCAGLQQIVQTNEDEYNDMAAGIREGGN
jgi:hypothetical protein